jgi:NADH-quinone oxidoreductase subunit A
MEAQSQFAQYLAVLMLLGLAIAAPFGMILVSTLLGKRGKRSPIKDTAYECGMIPVGAGNPRMSVKFHLVAMLFILFDIEVVFLYPWAVVYKDMLADVLHPEYRNMIFFSMISFLLILFAGYLYAVKKKAFDWKS